MRRAPRLAAALLFLLSTGAAEPPSAQDAPCPPGAQAEKTHFYPQEADARRDLETALSSAKAQGKLAVIVFGADWCHDSRALGRVLTSPAFASEFAGRYSVTFIDVGSPQTGEGRNLDLVKRFGVRKLKSTPALFVISPRGKRINSTKDAISWRNADSRSEAAMLEWFRKLAASGKSPARLPR